MERWLLAAGCDAWCRWCFPGCSTLCVEHVLLDQHLPQLASLLQVPLALGGRCVGREQALPRTLHMCLLVGLVALLPQFLDEG